MALKRLREAGQTQIDEEAIFTAIEAMRGIAEEAVAKTKTMRRHRERRLHVVSEAPPKGAPATACHQTAFEPLPANQRLFANVEEWS